MARYSDHTLEEIRNRLNIVDIISDYVPLKKTGQGYQGICPFHSEKSPSFHVHPEKQIFHCFGCHKGGNAFTFLMGVEGWSFPETVKKLADKAGIELPKMEMAPQRAQPVLNADTERLYQANEWAAKYFNYLLLDSKNPTGLKYLTARGLTEKTIRKFELGLSPVGWNTLMDLMMRRKYSFSELVRAGLVIEKEGAPNSGYDRFRNRVMFPIRSREGRVIGFGARQLDDDPKQPKYLNSSESPLFSKRNTLYGLFENQRGIRLKNEVVVVEGYMDVVGLYQAGVQNAVATMGTAFTEEHCVLLKGITRRVVTVFDPDKAGTEASRRSVHVFLSAGLFAKDLALPEELDPDEYVAKHSAEAFYDLCDKAPRQVTKLLKDIAAEGALTEDQRSKWLEKLTPILVASRRSPDRALLWDSISLVLQVSLDALREMAESSPHSQARPQTNQAPSQPMGPNAPKKAPKLSPQMKMELDFFLYAAACPQGLRLIPPLLWKSTFTQTKLSNHLDKLAATDTQEAFSQILAGILAEETDEVLLNEASAILFQNSSRPPIRDQDLVLLAERLLDIRKSKQIQSVTTQIKLAQRVANESEQLKLLERLNALRNWAPKVTEVEWLLHAENSTENSGLT